MLAAGAQVKAIRARQEKGANDMDLKRVIKGVGRSQKGFTLIELLVVVAILGVIAAVVVLNIGSFIGSGTVESANTEAHQVQTAVIAYMADNNIASYDMGNVGPATSSGPEDFLLDPARLQADYTVDTDGRLLTGTKIADSKWGDLTFTDGEWS